MPEATRRDGPEHHQHEHRRHRHHGHEHDRGIGAAGRYLRWLPQMWRSVINDAVIEMVDLRPGERGVDIGAGMGAGVIPAAETGAHVIAVEPTPFIRRVLRLRRMTSRRRTNIEVAGGAAERIPADDRTIDAIWAVNAMHHWVEVELAAAEIARVLRPYGRVLLVDEDFTDPSHPDHRRFGGDHDDERHGFTVVDTEMIGELLRGVGLTDVDTSKRQIAGRPVVSVAAQGVTADPGRFRAEHSSPKHHNQKDGNPDD